MKNAKKDLIGLSLLYIVITFAANAFSSKVALRCVEKLVLFLVRNFDLTAAAFNSVSMFALAILDLAVVLGIIAVFVRLVFSRLYKEDEVKLSFEKAAFLFIPGEAFRFFFGLSDLGFVDGSGRFTTVPSCLFQLLYLSNDDRHFAIRQRGEFIFADYAFYTLCYALYLAVFLVGAFLICKALCDKYGKDYSDL